MNDFIHQFVVTVAMLQQNLQFVLLLIACLYLIHILNWSIGFRLNYLGIYPRKLFGLPGIIFCPFLHGDFNHLFFNSIPLFVMVSFVLLNGMATFICVSVIVILLGGLGVWLFGRSAFHIGASGLIMGYWSYLLLSSYQHVTPVSIALAVVCIYYFGGLIFSLFPVKVKSSWESHVFGFLAGIAAGFLCPLLHYSLSYLSTRPGII